MFTDGAEGAQVVPEQPGGVAQALLGVVAALGDDELVQRAREVATAVSAAEADLAATLAEIERRDLHSAWECSSVERFAGWHCQVAPGRARRLAEVGRDLTRMPVLAEAVADGTLSFDKAATVVRVADPDTEQALVELAVHATVGQTQRLCRAWRRVDAEESDADRDAVAPGGSPGRVVVVRDEDGVELRARFDHVEGALVLAGLDAAAAAVRAEREQAAPVDPRSASGARPASVDEVPVERRDRSEWRAEGFLRLAETRLATDEEGLQPSGFRTQVVLHVGVDDLLDDEGATSGAELEPAGARVRREVARWFACDAGLLTVVEDDHGDPLHLGRRTSTVSPTQRRAVHARHRTCSFPGCAATVVQIHHVHHRAHGGHDDVENYVPECRYHHGLVHRRHLVVTRDGDGTVHHWRPDGTEILADPGPPAARPPATVAPELLERRRRRLGADPGEAARFPRWQGDPLRLLDAVDALVARRDAARRRSRPTRPPGWVPVVGAPPGDGPLRGR